MKKEEGDIPGVKFLGGGVPREACQNGSTCFLFTFHCFTDSINFGLALCVLDVSVENCLDTCGTGLWSSKWES